MQFIPILSSFAGATLTLANWQEVNTQIVSYYLTDLLMKPGIELLESLTNLRQYVAWPGKLVLNMSLLKTKGNGLYTLRSNYDGALIEIDRNKLFNLISKLDADILILPPAFFDGEPLDWQRITSKEIFARDRHHDLNVNPYYSYDNSQPFDDFYQQLKENESQRIYLNGLFNQDELVKLSELKNIYLESDSPAVSAMQGLIYNQQKAFDLKDSSMVQQYELLDKTCVCPTCETGFTRAYFHHLLEQTPLLSQRLLIMHNVFQMDVLQAN